MTEKYYITWEQVEEFVEKLIEWLQENNLSPTGVFGIPRGGITLATMLSYRLQIPLLLAPTDGCLIIDDIADSGRTLLHYTQNDTQENRYTIATMCYHSRSLVKPDFWRILKADRWIVFPWEESSTKKGEL